MGEGDTNPPMRERGDKGLGSATSAAFATEG